MPGGGYMAKNGTSMATPQVSGTVALMLEKNPALKPSQINKILEITAVDLGQAGKDNVYGAGRIDAYKAVFSGSDKILPIANFTSNVTRGPAPLLVKFTDLSESATKWNWDFGDGTYSTVKSPKHTYSKVGNYTVKLTVSNKDGSNSKKKNNYIKITALQKPVADFGGYPKSGKAPFNVTFTDASTGAPIAWKWSFGDGTYSTVKNPAHTYNKTGKYNVSLTVKSAAGSNTVTKSSFIVVNALKPPVPAFSASPLNGKAPLIVTFTDKSTSNPTSRSWDFGDKSTSTVKNPVHKYTKAGKYTVKLTVKNSKGTNWVTKPGYIIVK
jgi:serine protease AprX